MILDVSISTFTSIKCWVYFRENSWLSAEMLDQDQRKHIYINLHNNDLERRKRCGFTGCLYLAINLFMKESSSNGSSVTNALLFKKLMINW